MIKWIKLKGNTSSCLPPPGKYLFANVYAVNQTKVWSVFVGSVKRDERGKASVFDDGPYGDEIINMTHYAELNYPYELR